MFDTSASKIPSVLLPWLGVALVVVCIWCIIEIILRVRKHGLTKGHVTLVVICLVTVLFLGYGPHAVREILGSVDFVKTLSALADPTAEIDDLEQAMTQANSPEDRVLAFDVFSRGQPDRALRWLDSGSSVVAEDPQLRSTLQKRKPKLKSLKAESEARLSNTEVTVDDLETLSGLLERANRDPAVSRLLEDGRFDVRRLPASELGRLLRKYGAHADGKKIHVPRVKRPSRPSRP